MGDFYIVRVSLYVSGFEGVVFSGKIVKSLLVRAYPGLAEVFKPVSGGPPKLFHISPLYHSVNKRVRCVYSFSECRGVRARCLENPNIVRIDGVYNFYVGSHRSVTDPRLLLDSLLSFREPLEFMGRSLKTEIGEIEFIDSSTIAERVVDEALRVGGVKIVFSSPTVFRDPLREGRYKSFIPTVFNIFAVPVYINLYLSNQYTPRRLRRVLTILHRVLNETYTAMKTVRLKWVYYKKRPEPAVTGFVNLAINREWLEWYDKKIDVKKLLRETIETTITLGTGVGRATGFGHIIIKPHKIQQPTPSNS
ncbi:MAG: hypothetical protein ABWJ42_02130 [Sulfolobales archaeon]